MKEAYFNSSNLIELAEDLCCPYERLRNRRLPHFAPVASVLLVLDLQNYFLDPASHAFLPAAPAILPGVVRLTQAYVQKNLPVILTQHQNTPQDAGQMARWWRDLPAPNSPWAAIIADLQPPPGPVLPKTQYDAFYQTELHALLQQRGVGQVVICGVMTHLCCETTARAAFMRGFEVFFCADGTATVNAAHHRAALLNLAHGFATPVLVHEILEQVERLP